MPEEQLDHCNESENVYKLIVIGDNDSGKTSLMKRFAQGVFGIDLYPTCIPIDFATRTIELEGIRLKLQVWDTIGKVYLPRNQLWQTSSFFRGTVGVIVTYSATDEESFNNVPYWIDEVRKRVHPGTGLALVGTKCDCTSDKVVEYSRAQEFASERQIPFFEVSSKDGTNVELAFMTLVAGIRQLQTDLESSV